MIKTKHHGELIVGNAEIVPTDHLKIPFVISSPTMRVPMILKHDSVNVYLATRAVLLLVKYGVQTDGEPVAASVQRVAIPGMGTGVGRFPPEICALQMKQAIEDVVLEKYEYPGTWPEAQRRHQLLYGDDFRDLQY
jgi:O-acetyl-ADP-ribose deacetylase (regulator of RNase III)